MPVSHAHHVLYSSFGYVLWSQLSPEQPRKWICLHSWNTGLSQSLNNPPSKNLFLPKPIFSCTYRPQHNVYSADRVQMPSHSCNSHWHLIHQLTETERLINASHTLMAIVYIPFINLNFYRFPFRRRLTYPYKPVLKSVSTRFVGICTSSWYYINEINLHLCSMIPLWASFLLSQVCMWYLITVM